MAQAIAHQHHQPAVQVFDLAHQVAGVGCEQFGGSGRGRRAHVGDEVADRHIGLMADGTDDRRHAGIHGTRHGFFVEAPQVFQRTTATGQDQRIEASRIGQLEGAHNLRHGFAALYRRRDQCQFNVRRPAAKHADDVADYRAGRRTDNADAPRVRRQRHLAFGAEQAFGTEFFLQRIKGQAQRTIAGRLHGVEDQLVVATALEQRDLAAHLDRQAVLQCLAHPGGIVAKQRATHLGAAVLEGEIHVAGGRAGEVGDLAFDPDIGEHVFQQHPRAAVELADSQDFAVQAQTGKRIFNHGRQFIGIRARFGRIARPARSAFARRPAPRY